MEFIALIIAAAQASLALMDYRRKNAKGDEPALPDSPLNSLYVAATETTDYVEKVAEGEVPDRESERQLSKLWSKAADDLYPFNAELANRLYLKSGYWMNPEEWPEEKVKEAKISLREVRDEARKMLLDSGGAA